MAFKTTTEDFEKVFGEEKTPTERFLEHLTEYLQTRRMVTPFAEIYKRIKSGKGLSAFPCRYDVASDMTEILGENGIPCVRVLAPNGKVGFITSSDDDNAVADLQEQLLKKLGKFLPVYSGKRLRSMIDGKKHVSVMSIGGLSSTEAYTLRNVCQKETSLSAIGLDAMEDGTYKLSFFSDEVVLKGEKEMTLAQAFVRMKLLVNGVFGSEIAKRVERQRKYEELLSRRFDIRSLNGGKPVTLIGENGEYLKVTKDGMEYGNFESKDGETVYKPSAQYQSVMPDYQAWLVSFSSRLVNPIVANDVHELSAALKAEELSVTNAEIRENMAEKSALQSIASVLEAHAKYEPVMNQTGHYDKKFAFQVEQTAALLASSATGAFPNDYKTEEVDALRSVFDRSSLDMQPFLPVLSNVSSGEVSVEKKDIEMLHDINIFSGDREKDKATPTREDLGLR